MLDIFTTVYEKTNYKDRATCTSPVALIAGATGGVLAFVVAVCACVLFRKKKAKEDTFVRRTERSSTLEESPPRAPMAVESGNIRVSNRSTNGCVSEGDTLSDFPPQAPMAVESGNIGVNDSNTNGGVLEGDTSGESTGEAEVVAVIQAFDDLDEELKRRLINLRREG
jgi:hypothetical protein